MRAACIDRVDLVVALAERDPETLLGPVLWLLTRLARGEATPVAAGSLSEAVAAHCAALAAHPAVPVELRLAAGALAIEHRSAG